MSETNATNPKDEISKSEMLHLHWDNYKMRQSHFWRSFERLIFAVVTLWTIPFIKPTLIDYEYIVLFFPTVALLLSIVGTRLLKAEYARLMAVMGKFTELGGGSMDISSQVISGDSARIVPKQIGTIILKEVCIGLIVLSSLNLFLIVVMAFKVIAHP